MRENPRSTGTLGGLKKRPNWCITGTSCAPVSWRRRTNRARSMPFLPVRRLPRSSGHPCRKRSANNPRTWPRITRPSSRQSVAANCPLPR